MVSVKSLSGLVATGRDRSSKPRRQLDGRTEEIVVTLDRFAGGDADANLKRQIGMPGAVPPEILLHLDTATNGRGGRKEGRHDAVPSMFHFAPVLPSQGCADYGVVDADHRHRCVVTQPLRQARRSDDIGKEHSARARAQTLIRLNQRFGCPSWIHIELCAALPTPLFGGF